MPTSLSADPPTPADGRGSASEKRLQAARADRSLEHEHEATGKRQKTGKKKQRARRKVQKGSGMAQAEGSSMVFWPCDTFLSLDSCKKKASCKSKQASWQLAVQEKEQKQEGRRKQQQKQKDSYFLVASASKVRQYRPSPGGQFRPSLPCCLSVAKPLFSSLGS